MDEVLIIKQNARGEETWRYSGHILQRSEDWVQVEARFNRPDLLFHGILLRQDDRFVELFFNNRWYNIFEIHDKDDDQVKGWYCNITRPALIEPGLITYADLALDLLVYPDGRMLTLDEDEFAALELDETESKKSLDALHQLQGLFNEPVKFFEKFRS